ncbi:MAG: response regulator [Acidobacteria bacterium]|nr:response regulator [Acidobacteriota bacterium]
MSEPCILIVEDNEANLHLMKEVLKPLGFTILVANDGEEGVRMARENLPDLIVMDIQLPKMDGLTATRLIKSTAETCRIPIVAVTAHALLRDRENARKAGCNDYVTKPLNTRLFREKIRSFFQAVGSTPES